jgi:hypothetical protein
MSNLYAQNGSTNHGWLTRYLSRWTLAPNQASLVSGSDYFGTDPVAIDRVELDVIETKRREIGVISLWDRSPERLVQDNSWTQDPNKNAFVREPGHIEYAATLGLGVSELEKIKHSQFTLT